jgi:hypothetical protein
MKKNRLHFFNGTLHSFTLSSPFHIMAPTFALKIRDVLHFVPPDTNPIDPIMPFTFCPSKPCPMIAKFTSAGFRDFWRHERQAYDWEYRSNKFTGWYRSKLTERDLDLSLPDKSELVKTQDCRPGLSIQYMDLKV